MSITSITSITLSPDSATDVVVDAVPEPANNQAPVDIGTMRENTARLCYLFMLEPGWTIDISGGGKLYTGCSLNTMGFLEDLGVDNLSDPVAVGMPLAKAFLGDRVDGSYVVAALIRSANRRRTSTSLGDCLALARDFTVVEYSAVLEKLAAAVVAKSEEVAREAMEAAGTTAATTATATSPN